MVNTDAIRAWNNDFDKKSNNNITPTYPTKVRYTSFMVVNKMLFSSHTKLFMIKMFTPVFQNKMSRIVRKPDFCLGENKGADQLRGNREADQRLCFRYTDSTISLLSKSEISSF